MRPLRIWHRMCRRWPLPGVLGFLLAGLGALGMVSGAAAEGPTPKNLAVYYGWPSLVNGSNYNTTAAAAVFGQYQVAVFGEGIEKPTHGDHLKTTEIIQILHQSYGTRVFGYLNAQDWDSNGATNWTARIDMWAGMGVDGIFVDRFSYDWGITRTMQNGMLDAIHSRGLPAFVNGWFIDQIFSSMPDASPLFAHGNPSSLPSHMQATDMYLLESFVIMQGGYDVCVQQYDYPDSWIEKADKAFVYHQIFGSEMWTMTTANQLTTVSAAAVEETVDPRLSYAWYATAMYDFEGMGWTEPNFSATAPSTNLLPWRARPSPNPPVGPGTQFQNNVQHQVPLHTRNTDLGQYRVVCNQTDGTRTAEFVPWPVVPNIEIVREGSNARLSWLHQAANQSYEVWRTADLPYFDPEAGQGVKVASVPAGSAAYGAQLAYWDDGTTPAPAVTIIGDPDRQHFWVIRGANSTGVSSGSNRVGEFDFPLVPGQ